MGTWFYYENDKRVGPIGNNELRILVAQGVVTPETIIESESGRQVKAKLLRGLPFPDAGERPSSPAASADSVKPKESVFCTYCGKMLAQNAYACTGCGAAPVGHKNFCRHCGGALNSHQIICLQCGAAVRGSVTPNPSPSQRHFTPTGAPEMAEYSHTPKGTKFGDWRKQRIVAALLALFLGGIGIHKYYMGSWGWGLVYTIPVILTGGILGIVTSVVALIEGIMFLVQSDAEFASKYPDETMSPFRW